MNDLMWGLSMMVVGMGVVFLLLLLLMAVLMLTSRLDRPKPAIEPVGAATLESGGEAGGRPAAPSVTVHADGLDPDTVAAIAIAVITHAENRRKLAAPEVRAHEPGSQLFASRWVNIGRSFQHAPFRRR